MLIYSSFRLPIKYVITPSTPKLLQKMFFKKNFFLNQCTNELREGVNFGNKNIKKTKFYKSKKSFKINDIDANKILVSKKNHIVQKIYLNTLLDKMIMVTLYLYV